VQGRHFRIDACLAAGRRRRSPARDADQEDGSARARATASFWPRPMAVLTTFPYRTYHEHVIRRGCSGASVRSGAARRRGENVAPVEASQVERREAPHPYVTGVRAPSQGARRTLARFARGASQAPRRLPALHFLCVQRRRKKGKGRRPAPEIEVPGQRSVVASGRQERRTIVRTS